MKRLWRWGGRPRRRGGGIFRDRKSTRLNSSHANISYAVFCLKKKKKTKSLSFIKSLKNSSHTYISRIAYYKPIFKPMLSLKQINNRQRPLTRNLQHRSH